MHVNLLFLPSLLNRSPPLVVLTRQMSCVSKTPSGETMLHLEPLTRRIEKFLVVVACFLIAVRDPEKYLLGGQFESPALHGLQGLGHLTP